MYHFDAETGAILLFRKKTTGKGKDSRGAGTNRPGSYNRHAAMQEPVFPGARTGRALAPRHIFFARTRICF